MLAIPPLSALSHEPLLIDKHLESVTTSLLSVTAKLPRKRYHPHQSPAWTPQLKAAPTTCKCLYRNWVSCGRPRDPANPLRKAYIRMLKRIFVLNYVFIVEPSMTTFLHRSILTAQTLNDSSARFGGTSIQALLSYPLNESYIIILFTKGTHCWTDGLHILNLLASLPIFLSLQPKLRSPTNCSLFYTLLLTLLNFSPRKKSLLIFIHCHQRKLLDPTRLRMNIYYHALHYSSVLDAAALVRQLGPGALMAKIDLHHAYRIIPVHADDHSLLGIKWGTDTFVDVALPFGLRSAPYMLMSYLTNLLPQVWEFLLLEYTVAHQCTLMT